MHKVSFLRTVKKAEKEAALDFFARRAILKSGRRRMPQNQIKKGEVCT